MALRRLSEEHDSPLLAFGVPEDAPAVTAPLLVEGDGLLVSAIHQLPSRDALSVRLFNPSGRTATAMLRATRLGAFFEGGATASPGSLEVSTPAGATREVVLRLH